MKYLANAKSLKSATLARREKTVTGDLVLVTMSQTKVDYHIPS